MEQTTKIDNFDAAATENLTPKRSWEKPSLKTLDIFKAQAGVVNPSNDAMSNLS